MKVLFMLDSLAHSGEAREVVALLTHLRPVLAAHGITASLFVTGSAPLVHLLPAGTQIINPRSAVTRKEAKSIVRAFDLVVPMTQATLATVAVSGVEILPWLRVQWGSPLSYDSFTQRLAAMALYPWRRRLVVPSRDILKGMPRWPGLAIAEIPGLFDPTLHAELDPIVHDKLMEMRKDSSRPILAFVGKLTFKKGVDRLIDLYRRLPGYQLAVAGDGPLRNLIMQEPGVTWLGHVSSALEVIKNADVLLVTSRVEPVGMAMVEAVWANTPVVAFDCPGGLRNILQGELGKTIVPDGDTNAFVNAVKLVTSQSRENMMFDDRNKLLARVSPAAVTSQWLKVLNPSHRATQAVHY